MKLHVGHQILATRKVYGRNRVQIPKDVREELDVKDGDTIAFIRTPRGDIYIKRADTASIRLKGETGYQPTK